MTENKSTEEILVAFNLVPCVFPRDSLFTIVVSKAGFDLLGMNRRQELNRTSLAANIDKVEQLYYYASEKPIISFANSEFIDRHKINEFFVVLDREQFQPFGSSFMGEPEFDFIMVNQIMHTFAKEKGFMLNNITQEQWEWDEVTRYVDDRIFKWMLLCTSKMFFLMFIPGFFVMISAINGMVIRVALLCSNIILIPIMHLMSYTRLNVNNGRRAVIYHSMGIMGAQMAYYDQLGKSKFAFCLAIFICLTLTYFVQTCSFFIWQRLVFPKTFASGLGDLYFMYLNFFEFTWFLFARSRLTLKYYPKCIFIMNMAFFVYIHSYAYAPGVLFLMFIFSMNALILMLFI